MKETEGKTSDYKCLQQKQTEHCFTQTASFHKPLFNQGPFATLIALVILRKAKVKQILVSNSSCQFYVFLFFKVYYLNICSEINEFLH